MAEPVEKRGLAKGNPGQQTNRRTQSRERLQHALARITIVDHLVAPDGVRLMDVPPCYKGGTMRHFQRAETAAFFGREVGLMYVHAHLRYVQMLAALGDGSWRGHAGQSQPHRGET